MSSTTQQEMQRRQQAFLRAQTFSNANSVGASQDTMAPPGPETQTNYPGYNGPNTQNGYNGPAYGAAAGNYMPYSQRASYMPYQGAGAGPGSNFSTKKGSKSSGSSSKYSATGSGNNPTQTGPTAGSGFSGYGTGRYSGSGNYYSSDAINYQTGSGTDPTTRRFNMEGTAPRKQINEEYSYRGMSPEAYNGGGGARAAGQKEWGLMSELDPNTMQSSRSPGYRQDYGLHSTKR